MGWGAMMGLGQSLQQVGGMISDYNKDKMRAQLELEREQRAEARALAREQRQDLKYNRTDMEQDGEGVWWEVDRSNNNNVLDRRLAPKHKIDQINNESRATDLKLTRAQQEVDLGAISLENAPELSRLSLEEKRAGIAARRAQAESSRASAARSRALAAGGGKSSGSSSSDPRTAGLDKYTIETFFSRKDPEGEPIVDDDGNVQVDYNKLERYMSSPEYQTAKDKTAGVARFLQRTVPAERAERTSRGARAGLQASELESFIKSGDAGLSEAGKANEDDVKSIQASERSAIQAIDSGRLTVEEAAARMEAQGWPRAAARLRARYGSN